MAGNSVLAPALLAISNIFGPDLPDDIAFTPAIPVNPALRGLAFRASFDEGFGGHFSIPGAADNGAAANFSLVIAASPDDPFAFIEENLMFKPSRGSGGRRLLNEGLPANRDDLAADGGRRLFGSSRSQFRRSRRPRASKSGTALVSSRSPSTASASVKVRSSGGRATVSTSSSAGGPGSPRQSSSTKTSPDGRTTITTSTSASPGSTSRATVTIQVSGGGAIGPPVGPKELVLFTPGLNTLHAQRDDFPGETTTPERLQHYVDTLGVPMAQLHIGSDMDQGNVTINATQQVRDFVSSQLSMFGGDMAAAGFVPAGLIPDVRGGNLMIGKRQRDYIETLLSAQGLVRPAWQPAMLELLRRNEGPQRRVVLMPYSRTTTELSVVLKRYIEDYAARRSGGRGAAERLLFRTLTVVTIGNIDRDWPSGPAYVHLAGVSDREAGGTDDLTKTLGVSITQPTIAGARAVFINSDHVWAGLECHNFGSIGAGVLRLVMGLNGVTTFRGLWEAGQAGPLRLPTLEQNKAAIVLSGGTEWLWGGQEVFEGVSLPSRAEAEALLAPFW